MRRADRAAHRVDVDLVAAGGIRRHEAAPHEVRVAGVVGRRDQHLGAGSTSRPNEQHRGRDQHALRVDRDAGASALLGGDRFAQFRDPAAVGVVRLAGEQRLRAARIHRLARRCRRNRARRSPGGTTCAPARASSKARLHHLHREERLDRSGAHVHEIAADHHPGFTPSSDRARQLLATASVFVQAARGARRFARMETRTLAASLPSACRKGLKSRSGHSS